MANLWTLNSQIHPAKLWHCLPSAIWVYSLTLLSQNFPKGLNQFQGPNNLIISCLSVKNSSTKLFKLVVVVFFSHEKIHCLDSLNQSRALANFWLLAMLTSQFTIFIHGFAFHKDQVFLTSIYSAKKLEKCPWSWFRVLTI